MFEGMILLFGTPRSGTTWLGKIFDSHPQTLYFHEPDSIIRTREIPRLVEFSEGEQYREKLHDYLDVLMRLNGVKVRGKAPIFPKNYFLPGGYAAHRLSVLAAKGVSRWMNNFPILTPVGAAPDKPVRRVWKSIEGAGRLAAIAKNFPDIKGVYIVRHPCGYIASMLRGKRLKTFESDYDPGRDLDYMRPLLKLELATRHGLSVDNFRELSPVARMTWRWVLTNEKVLADLEGLPNCLVLRYEDMCVDSIEQSKRLFAFTGLPWSEQTGEFLGMSSTTADNRYYSVFRDSKQAADSWQKELEQSVIDEVLSIAKGSAGGELYEIS